MLKEKQQNMKHIPSVWVGRKALGPMGGGGLRADFFVFMFNESERETYAQFKDAATVHSFCMSCLYW